MKQQSSRDRDDWFGKAKSRLWSKERQDLSAVPPVALITGTFFYTGLSPFASGTVGSLAAAVLYYIFPALQNPIVLVAAILIVLAIGIWSSSVIERTTGVQDPGIVVIDEVLGQWITYMTFSHYLIGNGHLMFTILGFLFFRLFDIVKIWPAKFFERQHGGVGIMLDDAVAGIYANLATHLTVSVVANLMYAAQRYDRP